MRLHRMFKCALKAFVRNDESARYMLSEMLTRAIYPKYKFGEMGNIWLDDDEFIRWFEGFFGNEHHHSLERKFTLRELLKLTGHVAGDTAECGAFNGASSYLICDSIRGRDKEHHVFDSFEGLSEPLEHDGHGWRKGSLRCSEDVCRENLKDFHFVSYYKGWIPERFHEVQERTFSFVHVDVDLYQPTKDSMEFFYPRLETGGMLVCDDYGSGKCPGAYKALNEYLDGKPESVVMLTTGQGMVLKQ